jgi:hypothetical protein
MNKKITYIRQQRNYYSNKILKLYQLKRLFMCLAMLGILCWSAFGIYDFKLALDFLWLEGVNLFMVALIIFIDLEQESTEKLYETKKQQLIQLVKNN